MNEFMIDLDLMRFQDDLKVKTSEDKRYIFDPIRKKWLVLQPEELVRQLILLYLMSEKAYNKNRINVEKEIIVNQMQKRCDILVFDKEMSPFLLIECKAPQVKINEDVFKQAAWYNMALKVDYLMVTNGLVNYCCKMDYQKENFNFLKEVPHFPA